jgi:hypothetical protein
MTMAQRIYHPTNADAKGQIRQWVSQAMSTGTVDPYPGKRRHPRVNWEVPAIVRTESDGRARLLYVKTRNVSLGGVAVVCRAPLRAMAAVQVCMGGEEHCVTGRVMHCTQMLGSYLIGIEFDDVGQGRSA